MTAPQERIDALFRAAREAPVPAAPPFERARRRVAVASPRWAVPWVLLPLMAGAAAGSYFVVRAAVHDPSPMGEGARRAVEGPAEKHQAPRVEPEPETPKPPPQPQAQPPLRHAPIAARPAEEPPPPKPPESPAIDGPVSTLAEEAALIKTGFSALKTNQPAAASAAFDDYQRRFPNGTLQAEALEGSIRADQALGQYAHALESIERAQTLAPERRAELLVLEGELLLADGKPQPAVTAFDRALELHLNGALLERATRGRAAAAK